MGKTLLARAIAAYVINKDNNNQYLSWINKSKIQIFPNYITPISKKLFLNGWIRFILPQLLSYLSKNFQM